MKIILGAFLFTILIVPSFAGQLGNETFLDKGLKEFYQKRSFKGVSQSVLPSSDRSGAVEKLIEKVGGELITEFNKTLADGAAKPIDYDSCSGKCLQYGTSEFRTKATMSVGFVDLISKETRECQKVCKAYQLESYAYIDGMVYSKNHKEANVDCSGATVSSGRNTFKEHQPSESADAIFSVGPSMHAVSK